LSAGINRFSSSQVRVFSWSLGQYGWSCLGNAPSITGRESEGGTAIAVGVDVVLCGKAGTNEPLPAGSCARPYSRAGRAPLRIPALPIQHYN
jgi:hypothetical protein